MDQMVIDARYNESSKTFEVFSVDSGAEVIMLSLTHDEVVQQLKQMMIQTLQTLKTIEDSVKD
jgi:hypothetical protein